MSKLIDASTWPVVIVRVPPELSEHEVDAMLAELSALAHGGRPYSLVFDLRLAVVSSAAHRRRMAAHMEDERERIERCVKGLAMVAPSALTRGMVTALFWLTRPNIPARVFSSSGEAQAWATARLVE